MRYRPYPTLPTRPEPKLRLHTMADTYRFIVNVMAKPGRDDGRDPEAARPNRR